jgi:hypothetical protein
MGRAMSIFRQVFDPFMCDDRLYTAMTPYQEMIRNNARASIRARAELRKQMLELDEDVGRMALLLRALVEACLRKGVFTREELAALIARVDLLDGAADGRLARGKRTPKV